MKKVAILPLFFIILFSLFSILNPVPARADVFSSSNFRVLDPIVDSLVGRSTSTSFSLRQSVGQLALGTSTATSFRLNPGFLAFPTTTIPTVTAAVGEAAGNNAVKLTWNAATSSLGWTVSGYNVGYAATSSGPYIYTSVGNVTSSTRTGLTALKKQYFVVRPEDAFGNSIATSSEVSATPDRGSEVASTTFVSAAAGGTQTYTNADNTSVAFTIPANFFTEPLELRTFSYPQSVFKTAEPAPSGKDFAGKVYDFVFVATTTEGFVKTVSSPITISLGYADADVSGLVESTLSAYRRETGDTAWTAVSGATVNASSNTVTFSTTQFSAFALFGEPPPPAAPAPAPSGGGTVSGPSSPTGGGGGGGGGAPLVIYGSIVLQGRAYPGASVSVLLDGAVAKKFTADKTGSFDINISASSGSHPVGIFAEDTRGRKSLTFSFSSVVLGSAPTIVSGILLPPTLDLRAEEAAPRTLIVSGASQASSTVVLTFNSSSEVIHNTLSDANGIWSHVFDTMILEEGDHLVRAQAFLPDKTQTIFSESRTFTVLPNGILIAKKVVSTCGVADFNCDGRVNLVDFSILLFNWGTPSNPKTDLNQDGKVNITDFSIMLFHWTG